MSMGQGYDFGSLYGMADHSTITPLEPGSYDAVVEEASYGKTKDGTKGAWTIKFRVTTGDRANYPLTMTMSINPTKGDGSPNPQGMGIMFRQLGAMGVPIPPDQPFWALGWTEEQVALFITGKPVQLRTINEPYDGQDRTRVRDIRPARPGAPLEVQRAPLPNQQQGAMPGQWQQPQPGFAQGAMGGAQAQPWQQAVAGGPGYENQQPGGPAPGYGGGAQGWHAQPPQQGQAPGPWQNAQQPPQGPPVQGVPGAGGLGEFTPGGQSQQAWQQQPGYGQPPQGYGQPSQPGQGGQYQQQGPFQNAPGGPPANQGGPSAPPAGAGGQPGPYGQPQAAWNPTAEGAQIPGAQGPAQPGNGPATFSPVQAQQAGNGWGQQDQAPPAQFQPPQQPPAQQPQPQQPQQGAPELPPWAQ
jgi:hypothetical protein